MAVISQAIECIHCGSDQRGVDITADCSACGNAIADSINVEVIDAETMTIAVDVTCVGCGYNLRTLQVDSVCPECASPVVASLPADDLCFADMKWLRRVREGVTLLVAATLAGAVMLVVPFAVLLLLATIVVGVPGVWGMWIIATHDSRLPRLKRSRGLHRAVRLFTLVLCMLIAIHLILRAIELGAPSSGGAIALTTFGWLAAIGALMCTLACLRQIAVRAHRDNLRKCTTVLMWMVPLGVVAVWSFESALSSIHVSSTMFIFFPVYIVVCWVFVLVTFIRYRALLTSAIKSQHSRE